MSRRTPDARPPFSQDVLTNIFQAGVVVADITHANPIVIYEVGLSRAWEKDVLLTGQTRTKPPFYLGHDRYIAYPAHPRNKAWDQLRDQIGHALGFLPEPRGLSV